jgi:predicted metal-dependent hydrolase
VEVVLPARGRNSEAQAFLLDNSDWVLRHLRALQQKGWLRDPEVDGSVKTLLLQGREMRVSVCAESIRDACARVEQADDVITLHLPASQEKATRLVLKDWLHMQAADKVAERVSVRSAQMGLYPKRVFIRNQRTKWGNCSSLGNVSFNWRLIGAPPEVLDYVVVHELAHLKEMNHSPRFWSLVSVYCPDFMRHKAWLKANGGRLMLDF